MKILLGVDGSPYSEWAVDLLLKLPLTHEPKISVLHVVEPALVPPMIHSSIARQYHELVQKLMERSLETAQKLTLQVTRKLRERWKEVHPVVLKGSVPEKIIEQARADKADLIVVGSQGVSNVPAFLMGSVSQKVVTYAPCPVLVVKRRIRALKKVLLAVDGSPYSERALEFVTSHFLPGSMQVAVIYVWSYSFGPPKALPAVATSEGKYRRAVEQAGFTARALFEVGHPAARIVEIADRRKVDLVVIGARGLSGVKRFLLGSVSQKVMKYSQRSVLVVRSS